MDSAWRRVQVWGAAIVMAGTGGAVILTGWHTLPQVLAPLGIGVGCAVMGRALGPAASPPAASRAMACALVAVGVAMAFGARWGLDSVASADQVRTVPGLAVLLATVAAATCASIGLLGLAAAYLHHEAGAVTSAN